MTSRPRASPASWPNSAPVPASPRSAPFFEPLCPPVAWGSPKLRVCLLPECRVSRSRLPPHDSTSCPVTGGDHASASLGPWEASQEDSLLPQPPQPPAVCAVPVWPDPHLEPTWSCQIPRAAASGSRSCPAFPFSVHFGIWTLPVPLWPRFCVVFRGCVFFHVSVSVVRGPPSPLGSAPRLLARCKDSHGMPVGAWHQGPGSAVGDGGWAADRPPPGGAPLPLGAGALEGPGSLSPVKTEPCVTSTGFVSLSHVDKPSLRFRATSLTPGPRGDHESGPRPDSLTAAVTPSPSWPGLLTRGLGSPMASTSALLSTGTHVHARLLGRHPRRRLCRPFPCLPAAALSGASGLRRECLFSFSAPAGLRLGGQRACLAGFPIALLPREHKLTGTDLGGRLGTRQTVICKRFHWPFPMRALGDSPLPGVRTHPPPSVHAPATCLLRQSSASRPCLRCQLGGMSGPLRSCPLCTCTSAPPLG